MSLLIETVSDSAKARKDLDTLKKSVGGIEASARSATEGFKNMALQIGAAAAAFGTVKAFLEMSDTMTNLENKINSVSESTDEFKAALQGIKDVATKTRSDLSSTAAAYQRIAINQKELGIGVKTTLRIVETLNKALKVGGASAGEATSALLQFGQALGSGVLQGDELKSLAETAPSLLKALAEGLGKPVGELKKLGAAGELTTAKLLPALAKAAEKVDKQFGDLKVTFGDAFTNIGSNFLILKDRISKYFFGSRNVIATWINDVAVGAGEIAKYFSYYMAIARSKVAYFVISSIVLIRELFPNLIGLAEKAGTVISGLMKDLTPDFNNGFAGIAAWVSALGSKMIAGVSGVLVAVNKWLDDNPLFDDWFYGVLASIGKGYDKLVAKISSFKIDVSQYFSGFESVKKLVTDFVYTIERAFFWLYDRVIGNSWIPDLVIGVAIWLRKLLLAPLTAVKMFASMVSSIFRGLLGILTLGVANKGLGLMVAKLAVVAGLFAVVFKGFKSLDRDALFDKLTNFKDKVKEKLGFNRPAYGIQNGTGNKLRDVDKSFTLRERFKTAVDSKITSLRKSVSDLKDSVKKSVDVAVQPKVLAARGFIEDMREKLGLGRTSTGIKDGTGASIRKVDKSFTLKEILKTKADASITSLKGFATDLKSALEERFNFKQSSEGGGGVAKITAIFDEFQAKLALVMPALRDLFGKIPLILQAPLALLISSAVAVGFSKLGGSPGTKAALGALGSVMAGGFFLKLLDPQAFNQTIFGIVRLFLDGMAKGLEFLLGGNAFKNPLGLITLLTKFALLFAAGRKFLGGIVGKGLQAPTNFGRTQGIKLESYVSERNIKGLTKELAELPATIRKAHVDAQTQFRKRVQDFAALTGTSKRAARANIRNSAYTVSDSRTAKLLSDARASNARANNALADIRNTSGLTDAFKQRLNGARTEGDKLKLQLNERREEAAEKTKAGFSALGGVIGGVGGLQIGTQIASALGNAPEWVKVSTILASGFVGQVIGSSLGNSLGALVSLGMEKGGSLAAAVWGRLPWWGQMIVALVAAAVVAYQILSALGPEIGRSIKSYLPSVLQDKSNLQDPGAFTKKDAAAAAGVTVATGSLAIAAAKSTLVGSALTWIKGVFTPSIYPTINGVTQSRWDKLLTFFFDGMKKAGGLAASLVGPKVTLFFETIISKIGAAIAWLFKGGTTTVLAKLGLVVGASLAAPAVFAADVATTSSSLAPGTLTPEVRARQEADPRYQEFLAKRYAGREHLRTSLGVDPTPFVDKTGREHLRTSLGVAPTPPSDFMDEMTKAGVAQLEAVQKAFPNIPLLSQGIDRLKKSIQGTTAESEKLKESAKTAVETATGVTNVEGYTNTNRYSAKATADKNGNVSPSDFARESSIAFNATNTGFGRDGEGLQISAEDIQGAVDADPKLLNKLGYLSTEINKWTALIQRAAPNSPEQNQALAERDRLVYETSDVVTRGNFAFSPDTQAKNAGKGTQGETKGVGYGEAFRIISESFPKLGLIAEEFKGFSDKAQFDLFNQAADLFKRTTDINNTLVAERDKKGSKSVYGLDEAAFNGLNERIRKNEEERIKAQDALITSLIGVRSNLNNLNPIFQALGVSVDPKAVQQFSAASVGSLLSKGADLSNAKDALGKVKSSDDPSARKAAEARVESAQKAFDDTLLAAMSTIASPLKFAAIGAQMGVAIEAGVYNMLDASQKAAIEAAFNAARAAREKIATAGTDDAKRREGQKELNKATTDITDITTRAVADPAKSAGQAYASSVRASFETGVRGIFEDKNDGKGVLMTAFDTFAKGVADSVFDGLTKSISEALFSGGVEGVEGFGAGLFAMFNTNGTGNKPADGIGPVDTSEGAAGTSLFDGLKEKLKAGWDALPSIFSDSFSKLKDTLSGAFDAVKDIDFGGLLKTGLSFLEFADGGVVSGSGHGTSDSIPAMLSNGEFVVKAAATKRFAPLLHAINTGNIGRFAAGGMVGSVPSIATITPTGNSSASSSQSTFNINVTGNISQQTRSEIQRMIPQIARGTDKHRAEVRQRR